MYSRQTDFYCYAPGNVYVHIVTVTAPDFMDYQTNHVDFMARYESSGAAKNVASIDKYKAP